MNAAAFAQMKDGVRIVNCARGELIDLGALEEAIESGKVAGASLDVFPGEPMTEHPIFAHESVIVTPHLGASTAEAQDRAGVITAEQVVAALRGDLVSNAVNIPKVGSEDLAVLEPYLPLSAQLGPPRDVARARRLRSTGSRSATTGSLAELRHAPGDARGAERRLRGPRRRERQLRQRAGDRRGARHPGERVQARASRATTRTWSRSRSSRTATASRSPGTTIGPRHAPHLVSVYGQSFNIELVPHMAVFRYSDVPGMIGKVGTVLGEHGINIASTAVGREPGQEPGSPAGGTGRHAVMVVTVDSPIPDEVMRAILALEGFQDGRAVTL